jgi:Tfp pilus assembly protein PilZ
MKTNAGLGAFGAMIFILVLGITFYLLGFFLRYRIGSMEGITLALGGVFFSMSFFSLGCLFVILNSPVSGQRLLVNFSILILSLGVLLLLNTTGSGAFRIMAVVVSPVLALNLFILGLFVWQQLKSRINFKSPQRVTIEERRKFIRFRESSAVIYSLQNDKWTRSFPYDISGGGLRLVVEEEMPVQAQLDLKIYRAGDSRPIFAKGKVVWMKRLGKRNLFHVGVEFIDIEPGDRVRMMLKQLYGVLQERIA